MITGLATLTLLGFFLFDNYMVGIRPFDFLGYASIAFLLLLQFYKNGADVIFSKKILFYMGLSVLFLSVSIALQPEEVKSHIGIFLGFLVFLYYYHFYAVDKNKFTKIIDILLVVTTCSIFLQVGVFLLTGKYIGFVLFKEEAYRVLNSGGGSILRAGGFYMEPNSHCVGTALLILLRKNLRGQYYDKLSYAGILSMVMTLSLWGVSIAFLLMFFDTLRRPNKLPFIILVGAGITVAMTLSVFLKMLPEDNAVNMVLFKRVEKITDTVQEGNVEKGDGSFQFRYGPLLTIDNREIDSRYLFGHGVSTSEFQAYEGGNGISFFLYSTGIIGALLLFSLIFLGAPYKFDIVFAVLISLLSYPLVTYGIWWAWLALLFAPQFQRDAAV